QTSRSGSAEIRMARASRTAGWSSTIRTLTDSLLTFFLRLAIASALAESARYDGTGRFAAIHGQLSAHEAGTIAHDFQSHALGVQRVQGNAGAVVTHAQGHKAIFCLQSKVDITRFAMPQRISNCFLRDVIEMCADLVVRDHHV